MVFAARASIACLSAVTASASRFAVGTWIGLSHPVPVTPSTSGARVASSLQAAAQEVTLIGHHPGSESVLVGAHARCYAIKRPNGVSQTDLSASHGLIRVTARTS